MDIDAVIAAGVPRDSLAGFDPSDVFVILEFPAGSIELRKPTWQERSNGTFDVLCPIGFAPMGDNINLAGLIAAGVPMECTGKIDPNGVYAILAFPPGSIELGKATWQKLSDGTFELTQPITFAPGSDHCVLRWSQAARASL